MKISIQVRIDNSLLKNVMKYGVFPDSLENIIVMRVQDLVRRIKAVHGKIHQEVIRSNSLISKLYQVNVNIDKIELDQDQTLEFAEGIIETFSDYGDQITDIDMVIGD